MPRPSRPTRPRRADVHLGRGVSFGSGHARLAPAVPLPPSATMPENRLQQLHAAGVSIWLDFIDRAILRNGDLARRVRDDALTGMTSNPTIFEKALAEGTTYDDQIRSASGD